MNRLQTSFLFLIVLTVSIIQGQDKSSLPQETRELLGKLREFEKSEREQTETKILEKREVVANTLEAHLERATKSGNLDQAIKIRSVINDLRNKHATSDSKDSTIAAASDEEKMRVDSGVGKWIQGRFTKATKFTDKEFSNDWFTGNFKEKGSRLLLDYDDPKQSGPFTIELKWNRSESAFMGEDHNGNAISVVPPPLEKKSN